MFDAIISKYAYLYNIPDWWIRGVIAQESSWNPNAYKPEPQINDASYGLMQVLYSTAQGLGYTGDPQGLFDPDTNIALGTQLLDQLRMKWGDDIQAVYSAYNSGSGTAYLSNPTVADHVRKFMDKIGQYVTTTFETYPVETSGLTGIALILLVIILARKGR